MATAIATLTQIRASHPFDGSEVSDVILRTSDDVDFHILGAILCIASPFFKTMFSLPQNGVSDPVVNVTEASRILDPLLRLCYPVDDPVISDLTLLVNVLEAAMKYEVIEATGILTNRLLSFVEDKPREVFALACRLSLEKIASVAARRWRSIAPKVDGGSVGNGLLVGWDSTIVGQSYIEDMANISAGAFYRLTQFVRSGIETPFCYMEPSTSPGSHQVPIPNEPITPISSFDFADYDLMLRSSDGIKFKVHYVILRLASPTILKDASVDEEGKKHLSLPERSNTVSILLQSCYPSMTVDIAVNIHDIRSSFHAAVKYKMIKAIDTLKVRLKAHTNTQPLDVYFAFIRSGFIEEATEIARTMLCFMNSRSLYAPVLEEISADSYYQLLHYRHRCRFRILAIGSKYESIHSNSSWWAAAEESNSDLLYFAGPIIEKIVLGRDRYGSDIFSMSSVEHEEIDNLKKEIKESLEEASLEKTLG